MPRVPATKDQLDEAMGKSPAQLVAELVGEPTKRSGGTPKRQRHAMIEDVRRRWKEGDWDGMKPGRLVAVYYVCHEMVYDVAPTEVDTAGNWKRAMMGAGKLVKELGSVDAALEFIRWVWLRERGREKWRRDNGNQGSRIGWRLQLVNPQALLTDWRVEKARKQGMR